MSSEHEEPDESDDSGDDAIDSNDTTPGDAAPAEEPGESDDSGDDAIDSNDTTPGEITPDAATSVAEEPGEAGDTASDDTALGDTDASDTAPDAALDAEEEPGETGDIEDEPGETDDAAPDAEEEPGETDDTAPDDTAPDDTAPDDTAPDDTAPDDTAPDDTAPDDTAPDDTAPDDTAPDDTAPDDTAPDDTAPDDTAPDDTAPDDTASDADEEPGDIEAEPGGTETSDRAEESDRVERPGEPETPDQADQSVDPLSPRVGAAPAGDAQAAAGPEGQDDGNEAPVDSLDSLFASERPDESNKLGANELPRDFRQLDEDGDNPDDFRPWEGEGEHLTPSEHAAAAKYLRGAKSAEPAITADMKDIAQQTGGRLEGLKFRLKDDDSFKRKFASDIADDARSVDDALGDAKDTIRYTVAFDELRYADGVSETRAALDDAGYQQTKFKYTWGEGGYQGINCAFRTPDGSGTVEVQFHTPESFAAKMATHDLYKEARSVETSPERRIELARMMENRFVLVPQPPGVQVLKPEVFGGTGDEGHRQSKEVRR